MLDRSGTFASDSLNTRGETGLELSEPTRVNDRASLHLSLRLGKKTYLLHVVPSQAWRNARHDS